MSKSTAIIIVATSPLMREGIASLLQNTPYKVLATAAGPAELQRVDYSQGQPILAIVGINDEKGSLDECAESVRALRSVMRDGKVVLIVETNGAIELQSVLTLSPDACIFNLGSRDTLIKMLELVLMDQCVFVLSGSTPTPASAPAAANNAHDSFLPPTAALTSLSQRERQILVSLAEGKSNKVIARQHNLAEATVKVHLKAILRKTKTHNRTQAAIWAIQHHFLEHSIGLAPVGQTAPIRKVASDRD